MRASGRDAPVVSTVIFPAGDFNPAGPGQQFFHRLTLLPADFQSQGTAGAKGSLVVFRNGPVKFQAILPRRQSHGRFPGGFGLKMFHLLSGQIGRVGDDEIQLPLRQGLPIGEEIPCHRLHRRGRIPCPARAWAAFSAR